MRAAWRIGCVLVLVTAVKESAPVAEHRLRRETAKLHLACPIPMQMGSCQVNEKHPCAPLGQACTRPCGVFHIHMRGTGGKFFGENIFNHLFRRDVSFWIIEGSSLAVPRAKERFAAMLPGSLRTVILRHPIERILSRYWMEGRWDLFKKSTPETATPLEKWIEFTKKKNTGSRLWQMPQEFYLKTFSGWEGKPFCDTRTAGCFNGLGPAQVQEAQALVTNTSEWLVLISEWLSAPAQVEVLASKLCFATDGQGNGVTLNGESVPNFKPKRAAGSHSAMRPIGWTPNSTTIEMLWRDNAHDLQLYEWAARRMHSRVTAQGGPPPPLLPPIASPRAFETWLTKCRDAYAALPVHKSKATAAELEAAGCTRGEIFHEP